MSLTDLNPTDASQTSLPRYDPQILIPSIDTIELSNFGWASDITNSNDLYVISQPNFYRNSLDTNATNLSFSGSTAYALIYQNVDSNWNLIQTIDNISAPITGSTRDNFGFSVSFSKTNGQYLSIGTFNRTSSVALAYVFLSDQASTPTYTLQETFNIGNFGSINNSTNIGFKVKLNAAGDHLLLMGTTGIIEQFSRSGITWTHDTGDTIAAIAGYTAADGSLCDIDANSDHSVIIRGCPLFPTADAKSIQTGQVDIFRGTATAAQTFTGSVGDRIGAGVAISSNALFMAYSAIELAVELDLRVIDTSGTVSIYNTSSGNFTLQQTITGSVVDASSGSFGNSLALTEVGDKLVIGDAYANNYSGAVYAFSRADDVWSESFQVGASSVDAEVVVLDSTNNVITILDKSDEFDWITTQAALTIGSYTGSTLATELASELTSQIGSTFTASYDNTDTFFTITQSSSDFSIILDTSTIASIIGFASSGTIELKTTQSSSSLPSFSYNGTELGRNVELSQPLLAFIGSGYPGKIGPQPNELNGIGKGLIGILSTELNLLQSALTIDTTDVEALLVRKNNDTGDVFTVDTRTGDGIVISNGILCANNTTESTSSPIGSLVVKGGVGIAKDVFIDGNVNIEQDINLSSTQTQILSSAPTSALNEFIASPSTLISQSRASFIFGDYLYCKEFSVGTLTGPVFTIDSISKADPAVVTTTSAHGFDDNEKIAIGGNDLSNPTANGINLEAGDVLSSTTFELMEDGVTSIDTTLSTGTGLGGTVQEWLEDGGFSVLAIYDISDALSPPVRLSQFTIDLGNRPIYVVGDYLFGVSNSTSFFSVNVLDRSNPVLLDTYTLTGSSSGLTVSGNFAYVITTSQLEIIDISNPGNNIQVSTLALSSFATADMHVKGNYVYIQGEDNFYVIDISDKTTPTLITTFALDASDGSFFEIQGNFAYCMASTSNSFTLQIVDISDPTSLVARGSIGSGVGQLGSKMLRVAGNYVFMMETLTSTIPIYNVSDPDNLQLAATIENTINDAQTIQIQGKYLYVTGTTTGQNLSTIQRFLLENSTLTFADISSLRVGTLDIHKDMRCEGDVTFRNINVGGVLNSTQGISSGKNLTISTFDSTDNVLNTRQRQKTGSFQMADNTGGATNLVGLIFAGEKMFIVEAYVEISAGTDLWSHYRFVAVNESLTSNAWTLTVVRTGVTDPNITFTITAAGQIQYDTPAYAATFVSANIYYTVTNIV